ncbi:MAG: hypothetical protein JNK49_16740 [Planctomycetes bacterium]|nr:hypothetical protein [Planctomycetota bacterium]
MFLRHFGTLGLLLASCAVPAPLAEPLLGLRAEVRAAPWLAAVGSTEADTQGPPLALELTAWAHRDVPPGTALHDGAPLVFGSQRTPFPGFAPGLRHARWAAGATVDAWLQDAALAGARQPLGNATGVVGPHTLTWFATERALPPLGATTRAAGLQLWFGEPDGELLLLPTTLAPDTAGLLTIAPAQPGAPWYSLVLRATAAAEPPKVPPPARLLHLADPAATAPGTPADLAAAWHLARTAIGSGNRRPALLAMAQRLGQADLADLVLAADDQALRRIAAGLPDLGTLPTGSNLAWQFVRSAWQALLPLLWRGELAPGLRASLYRHLGAATLDPGALAELLADSSDPADLRHRLREWHRSQLGDRRASQRVRAHDWLVSVGADLPGYDPLAEAAERTAALRAAEARR